MQTLSLLIRQSTSSDFTSGLYKFSCSCSLMIHSQGELVILYIYKRRYFRIVWGFPVIFKSCLLLTLKIYQSWALLSQAGISRSQLRIWNRWVDSWPRQSYFWEEEDQVGDIHPRIWEIIVTRLTKILGFV